MTIQAFGKVNLVLRICGNRPDGYHDIETLMVPVSLADEVEVDVEVGAGTEIACDQAEIPTGPENLVWRAAEIFQRRTGRMFRTRITLRKRIPHGAGLGGGSSDAAAVLRALDQLTGTHQGSDVLEDLAAQIGSDIPFFIRSVPAWCRGRGERTQPAPEVPAANILLLKPPFPVSTAWAYQAWQSRWSGSGSGQKLGGIELENDLEAPVFAKHLLLPALKSWLLDQREVSAAMMSGSGSTLFAILKQPAGTLAQRAKAEFGATLWTAETCLQTNPRIADGVAAD